MSKETIWILILILAACILGYFIADSLPGWAVKIVAEVLR